MTFDSIVEAGEQVLLRDGLEALRTTTVAERAGVSPGSLYQYFRDKDAIVLVIAQRKVAAVYSAVVDAYADNRWVLGVDLARAMLAALVGQMKPDLRLLRELSKGDSLRCDSIVVEGYLAQIADILFQDFQRRRWVAGLKADRNPRSFLLLSRAVWDSCVQTLALEPEHFAREEFVEELEALTDALLSPLRRPEQHMEPQRQMVGT